MIAAIILTVLALIFWVISIRYHIKANRGSHCTGDLYKALVLAFFYIVSIALTGAAVIVWICNVF